MNTGLRAMTILRRLAKREADRSCVHGAWSQAQVAAAMPHGPMTQMGKLVMPPLFHISARVEGAPAASAVAEILDELTGGVSAFETREAAGAEPAEWLVETYAPARRCSMPRSACVSNLPAASSGGAKILARSDRRNRSASATGSRRKPPRLSAAADRPLSDPRLALAREAASRQHRNRNRRGDGLRHRRASLDPRLLDRVRSAGMRQRRFFGGRAEYRDGQRHPRHRGRQAVAPPRRRQRPGSGLGPGGAASCAPQRHGRVRVRLLRGRRPARWRP